MEMTEFSKSRNKKKQAEIHPEVNFKIKNC